MPDITKLSAAKIEALMTKWDAQRSQANHALIEAGYGHERISETYQRAAQTGDPLARHYVVVADECCRIHTEMEARKRYHGTLRPIKRMTW